MTFFYEFWAKSLTIFLTNFDFWEIFLTYHLLTTASFRIRVPSIFFSYLYATPQLLRQINLFWYKCTPFEDTFSANVCTYCKVLFEQFLNQSMYHDGNTKGQLISKEKKLKYSFEPKSQRNYFYISALAISNESNQKDNGSLSC